MRAGNTAERPSMSVCVFTRTQIHVGLGAQFLTNRESGLWWVFRVSVSLAAVMDDSCAAQTHTVCNHRPSGVLLSVRGYPAGVKVSCLLRQPQESVGPTRQLRHRDDSVTASPSGLTQFKSKHWRESKVTKLLITIHACMFRIFHIHVLKLKSQSV